MDKIRIAKAISLVFGYPWVLVIIYVLIFKTGLSPEQMKLFFVVFTVLSVGVPTVYYLWARKVGRISDIDITKREERLGMFTIIFVKNIIAFMFAWHYGNSTLIALALIVFMVFAAVYVITFFWKISMHMVMNVLGITLLNWATNWEHMYLFILIPITFWARLILKKHTRTQLLAGFLLTEAIIVGGLWVFGLM